MDEVNVAGVAPGKMFELLLKNGLTPVEAKQAIGHWLIDDGGGRQRVFEYSVAFPETDPDDASHFVRVFDHEHWRDGVDMVQAEGVAGFNQRFDALKGDLDALGDEVRRTFAGLAEIRSAVAQLLADVRSELNRVNADLFRLSQAKGQGPIGSFEVFEPQKVIGVTKFFDKEVLAIQGPDGIQILPKFEFPPIDPGPSRVNWAGGLATLAATNAEFAAAIAGGTTKEELVAKFPDLVTTEGVPLTKIIDVLPAQQQITGTEQLVSMVAERQAAVVRATGGKDAALITNISGTIGAGVGAPAEVGVEKLEGLPANVKEGLIKGGVTNVGRLAESTPVELHQMLKSNGVEVSLGEVAGWSANAKTLKFLQ